MPAHRAGIAVGAGKGVAGRIFFFGADLGKLANPSYQTVLEGVFGIRNQSNLVLMLSHSSVR